MVNHQKAHKGIHPELYPKVQQVYHAFKEGGLKAAKNMLVQFGAITGDDFQNVKATLLSSKLLGVTPQQHILTQMVTQEQTNRLDLKVRKWFEPDNQIVQQTGFFNIQGDTMKGKFQRCNCKNYSTWIQI